MGVFIQSKWMITALVIIFLGAAVFLYLETAERTQIQDAPTTYRTQAECEAATGAQCDVLQCDYVPPGKSFEEVCGRGFAPGWAPRE